MGKMGVIFSSILFYSNTHAQKNDLVIWLMKRQHLSSLRKVLLIFALLDATTIYCRAKNDIGKAKVSM